IKMPKDCNSLVLRKARRSHPYDRTQSNPNSQGSTAKDGEINAEKKQWDDARCPICMEHPHNAVLLLCSSHDKGCQPYMCDTSYRHSNCLDQYRKRKENWKNSATQDVEAYNENQGGEEMDEDTRSDGPGIHRTPGGEAVDLRSMQDLNEDTGLGGPSRHRRIEQPSFWTSLSGGFQETQNRGRDDLPFVNATAGVGTENNFEFALYHRNEIEAPVEGELELKCPLCRGSVSEWKVVEDARNYLNLKVRSCARESCFVSGTYDELRKHARRDHPRTRPADIDPSRQRAWRRLEHQRDVGDVLSTIRTAIPNAIVHGDYVIEGDEGDEGMPLDQGIDQVTRGPLFTAYFLFRMLSPIGSSEVTGGFPARVRVSSRHHTSSSRLHGGHPNMLGENSMDSGSEETDNIS
ncbi:hypothetical protein KI387_032672, partial [Taxus chinensis]